MDKRAIYQPTTNQPPSKPNPLAAAGGLFLFNSQCYAQLWLCFETECLRAINTVGLDAHVGFLHEINPSIIAPIKYYGLLGIVLIEECFVEKLLLILS
ncbi:hypothetical protein [uncultured Methanomethylovorans sp.]|uniref:hypothetical protein n=1 Tax=uncultured Methanomethylovorans sp. TaxID=183759 RepID=UPI002AA78F75|nr:hypothetical protein [uncultured Methanomethylovorans sp.]